MVGPPQCRPPMNHAKRDSGILKTIEAKTICQSSVSSQLSCLGTIVRLVKHGATDRSDLQAFELEGAF
jgi:hypothetical protein